MDTTFAQSVLQRLMKTGCYAVLDQRRGSGTDLQVWIFRERPGATDPLLMDDRPDAFVLDCEFFTEGTVWDVARMNTGRRSGTEQGQWSELEDVIKWITDHLADLPTNDQHRRKHSRH